MIVLDKKKLHRKLIRVFNKFIRTRDRNVPCISCGIRPVAHAGHYYSTSQCPQGSMRFNEKNVNGQCVTCNSFQEGNRHGYEKGLIKKYGPGVIRELEILKSIKQNPWTAFEISVLIDHYEKRTEALHGQTEKRKSQGSGTCTVRV